MGEFISLQMSKEIDKKRQVRWVDARIYRPEPDIKCVLGRVDVMLGGERSDVM